MLSLYILNVVLLCFGVNANPNVTSDQELTLTLYPPSGHTFSIYQTVSIRSNFSEATINYINTKKFSQFYLGVFRPEDDVYGENILKIPKTVRNLLLEQIFEEASLILPIPRDERSPNGTSAPDDIKGEINQIGQTRLQIKLLEVTVRNFTRTVITYNYLLRSERSIRTVDLCFNVAITILGILNTFALGCVTSTDVIKNVLTQRRTEMLVTLLVQYLMIPLITISIAKIGNVQNEVALGFLFLTCVPGGGLGHLIVSITGNTDVELSVTLNVLQLLVPIGTVPLYVYSLGQLLPNGAGVVVGYIYYLVIWLVGLLIPYVAGIAVRKRRESVADAFLNWLIKPVLLLAFILFITLGLYINMYVFSVLNNAALICGALIPFIGFGIGGGLMALVRKDKRSAKTLAIESAIMNSIVMVVALRATLPQPDADLASAAAMWVLYVTPVPFVLMFVFHRIKRSFMNHFNKKDLKKEQKTTIMNSFAAITQNALQMGGLALSEIPTSSSSPPTNNKNGDRRKLLMSESGSFNQSSPHIVINNVSFIDNSDEDQATLKEDDYIEDHNHAIKTDSD